MINNKPVYLLAIATFAGLLFVSGCSDDGAAENAGEAVDETIEDAGDEIEEATE